MIIVQLLIWSIQTHLLPYEQIHPTVTWIILQKYIHIFAFVYREEGKRGEEANNEFCFQF